MYVEIQPISNADGTPALKLTRRVRLRSWLASIGTAAHSGKN